jgi:hypothetical protein
MKDAAIVVGVEKEPVGLSFRFPDGFDLEDAEPGDVIERVVSIKVGPDRNGSLVSIEGIPFDGGAVAEVEEEEDDDLDEDDLSDTDIVGNIKKSIGIPI